MQCTACGYQNNDLDDNEILEKEKIILKEIGEKYRDILQKYIADPIYQDLIKRRDEEMHDAILEQQVIPFFPFDVKIGYTMNRNFSKLCPIVTAWSCPKCGTLKIDTGTFDYLEKQHSEARGKKKLDLIRQMADIEDRRFR